MPDVPVPEGFWLPGATVVAAADADEVPLPPGATGELTLFLPGRVPSTIALDGAAGEPAATHPGRREPADGPAAVVDVTGHGPAGAFATFSRPGRGVLPNAVVDGAGAFSIPVEVTGPAPGLVVLRDGARGLAVAPATAAPGGPTDVGTLVPAEPVGTAEPPDPPPGLLPGGGHLLAELPGGGRATVMAYPAGPVPVYALGLPAIATFEAASEDGTRAAFTGGAPGLAPAFLRPPDLARVARVRPGQAIAWPAVGGATVYTARLFREGAAAPTWEALLSRPEVTVPLPLSLHGTFLLRVEAWDAPGKTVFSLAGLRALRLPDEPDGGIGRASAATKRFAIP